MTMRVPTGQPKLDSLMEGGFLKNNVYLITGGTGTGKTIFCLQFLWEGLKRGEPCVYLSLEEEPEDIKADARQFGWDLDEYEEKGLFRLMFHDPFETDVSSILVNQIENLGILVEHLTDRPISGMIVTYDLGQSVVIGFKSKHGLLFSTHLCPPWRWSG